MPLSSSLERVALDQKYLSIRLKAGFTDGAKVNQPVDDIIVYWKNRLKRRSGFCPRKRAEFSKRSYSLYVWHEREEVIREGIKRFASALESSGIAAKHR